MLFPGKPNRKRKSYEQHDVLVIPEIKIHISFQINFGISQNNQLVESKSVKHEPTYIIQDDMSYNRFLDVKNSRTNLIFYSQIIKQIYLPDRLPHSNQDRHFFPIYIQHSMSEYHAGVLLWEKIIRLSDRHWYRPNVLYYFDSRGDKPDDTLLNAFKELFPNTTRIIYNGMRHQVHDYMCTSYAFNAADRFLNGESFQDICHNATPIEELVKYRTLIKKLLYNEQHDIIDFVLCRSSC
jgi:hypothetical protein